jgi:large subunit ribosomal protein L22e
MAPTKSTTAKKVAKKVIIDCTAPVGVKVIDLATFEKFLHDRIKVDNKAPAKAGAVTITRDKTKVTVTFNESQSSKRYVKYLTKKYLKKQQLKEYLRVIMGSKNSYELKYYKLDTSEEKEEEE